MTLSAAGITKRYGGFVAVDGFSFEIQSDSIVGLIGPNGAGKSTLFSVLSGFIRPEAGRVAFNGHDLSQATPEARSRAGLARTFQVPQEFTHLTVRENLAVAVPDQPGEQIARVFFRPDEVHRFERSAQAEVDETLELIGLDAVAHLAAGMLSGGQRKLLELGRLLLVRPKLMLLDEPFAGVNPVLIDQISDLIVTLNARGIGFLIVEHNLEALVRLVRHLFVMDRGRLLASGSPSEVLETAAVREAYLGATT